MHRSTRIEIWLDLEPELTKFGQNQNRNQNLTGITHCLRPFLPAPFSNIKNICAAALCCLRICFRALLTLKVNYFMWLQHGSPIGWWSLYNRVGPFFQPYFAHLLFCRTHFPDSHGMFLFAYNFQEPSGICIFLTSNFYI